MLSDRFFDAVRYAGDAHAGQLRKGTSVPYLGHLLGVASIVLDAGGDEDEAIAALLHDAAEDAGGRVVSTTSAPALATASRASSRPAPIRGTCRRSPGSSGSARTWNMRAS
jgi:predicted HD phosphohydrolase